MTINVRKIALFVLFAVVGVLEIGLRTQAAFRDFTSDLQIYLKYGTFSLALLVFLFFITKIRTTRMALLPLMFALFSLGSCLYSPDPLFSVSQVLVLLAQLGVVFLVASYSLEDSEKVGVWNVLLAAIVTKIILSLFLFAAGLDRHFLPAFRGDRFSGLLSSPNSMGAQASVGALICFVFLRMASTRRGKMAYAAIGGFCFVSLLATQSRTAMLGFVTACLAVVFVRNRSKAVIAAILLLAAATIFWSANQSLAIEVTSRGQTEEQLTTLQGRTQIWNLVWRLIQRAPWFGNGYASSKAMLNKYWDVSRYEAAFHSHNMFLEALLTLGVFGTLLLLVVVIVALVKHARIIFRAQTKQGNVFHVGWGMICLTLMAGIAEPSVASAQNAFSLVFLLSFALCATPGAGKELLTSQAEGEKAEAASDLPVEEAARLRAVWPNEVS